MLEENYGTPQVPNTASTQQPADSILEQQTPEVTQAPKQKSLSFLGLLLLVSAIAATAAGIFLQYQISQTNQEITATQQAIESQAQNILSEDNQEVSLSTKKAFLDLKQSERKLFKNVLQDLDQDIIRNQNFNTQSLSINTQGQISANMNSTIQSLEPLRDSSRLLENLTQRSFIETPFIPAITQSLTETGLSQIQFNLQMTHNENAQQSETTEETTTPIPESTERPSPIISN